MTERAQRRMSDLDGGLEASEGDRSRVVRKIDLRFLALWACFSAEVLALWAIDRPLIRSFDAFAFGDSGSNLVIHDMMDRGFKFKIVQLC